MKIRVTERCQGHMMCVLAAPDLFEIDNDLGYAHALSEDVPQAREREAQLAAQSCPESAIEITG